MTGIMSIASCALENYTERETAEIENDIGWKLMRAACKEFLGPCRNLALGYHVWMAFYFPFTIILWNCCKRLKWVYLLTFGLMPLF
jgi:hypothetical protein